MTNIKNIENKISNTEKYFKILERYKKFSREEIENNVDIRGMVERYLYLAVQSTIDLAETVIAYKKLRKPTTMSESFHILYEEEIIGKELANKMVNMVGFRNIMSHDYEKIDYDIVYDILHLGLDDIKVFLKVIKRNEIV